MKVKKLCTLGFSLLPLISCGVRINMNDKNIIKQISIADKVSATSSNSDHDVKFLNDGNYDTYRSANNNEEQTIYYDLGEIKSLLNVTQVFAEDDIWYFTIEASLDNKNFYTVVDYSYGIYGKVFSKSISGFARYIKMTIHKSKKGLIPTSKEFYVDASFLSKGTNVALGLKGDASSGQNNYLSEKAYDGDNGTFWCAGNSSFPQWISGEWNETIFANDIEIVLQDYGEYTYEVEARTKDGSWIKLVQKTTKNCNHIYIDVNQEINAIAYRVFNGPGWANVAEIKVNGFENVQKYIGKDQVFVKKIVSSNDIKAKINGKTENIDKNNSNVIVDDLENLSSSDTVYGTRLDSILNYNFNGQMTSYLDESHHISSATIPERHKNSSSAYFQSSEKGKETSLTFDLGNKCLINGFYQEFLNENDHKFMIESSLDGEQYNLLVDKKENSIVKKQFEIELYNQVKARYIKLTIYPKSNEYATSVKFYIRGNGSSVRESWWQNTSGVVRFYPKEQKVTLREIKDRLDEFRYSGYRVIELHQPYEGKADIWAGLGATNNYQVDPVIGNLNDLTDLLNEAHSKGIKVFMFGNVGYGKRDSDLFRKAERDVGLGINSKEANYFLRSKECKDPSKWFFSDVANCYYYGYWGEDGQIPTYNFANKDWQDETYNYIKFWAEYGLDGIALDAPDVYYYGTANSAEITFNCITSTLRKNNLFSLPEGSGNTGFISNFKYCGVQNYNMTSWGAGALSLGLCAAQDHSANGVDGYLKGVRDTAVSLGGISIDGMNFEDNYDEATTTERILESALVTTTGHMAFLHIGSSAKIGQDIIKTWSKDAQDGVSRSFALQNSLDSLNASGERTALKTNDDSKYYAFYKSNMNGNNKSIVVFNYKDSNSGVNVDLTGTPFENKVLTLYDAYNDEYFELTPDKGVVNIYMKANSHRVLIVRD